LKPAEYVPPSEDPDDDYPYLLTTGRLVHHFHTRTKTGRASRLRAASPDETIEIASQDAFELGIREGDWIRITSRRSSVEAQASIGDIERGHVFLPFHFGYWDNAGRARAANELTIYEWDAVSKQPHFKYAAVRLEKVSKPSVSQPQMVDLHPQERPGSTVGHLAERVRELAKGVLTGVEKKLKPERSHIADYIGLLDESEKRLLRAFEQIRTTHPDEPDIGPLCKLFGQWSEEAEAMLKPFVAKYGERRERVNPSAWMTRFWSNGPRAGSISSGIFTIYGFS
jgi:ferredoxin-nitrate reductase